MDSKLYTYDPKKVMVSFGSHLARGFSDGTFINIEANGDGVTKKVGCDGEVVRSIDPDGSAKISVTFLYGSPSAKFLENQYDIDRKTCEGTFPVLVKDLRGNFVFSASSAWVVKKPGREFGKEASDFEFEIDTGDAVWGDA